MKISGQSKVKSFTRKFPRHTKITETSNYTRLAMKGPEVAFEFTLTSRRVYSRAQRIKNHKLHELA